MKQWDIKCPPPFPQVHHEEPDEICASGEFYSNQGTKGGGEGRVEAGGRQGDESEARSRDCIGEIMPEGVQKASNEKYPR